MNIGRYSGSDSLFLYGCDNDKLKSYAGLWKSCRHQTFGCWENNSLNDSGVFLKGDQIVWRSVPEQMDNEAPTLEKAGAGGGCGRETEQTSGSINAAGRWPVPGSETVLGSADFSRRLLGRHNLINALVTLAVAEELFGLTQPRLDLLFRVIGDFAGLEHRLEYVGCFAGIDFYDDSISTIPAAALAAIGSIPRLQTLILGGYDRGIGYDDFVRELNRHQDLKLICLPATGHKLLAGLCHRDKYRAADMAEAVELAFAVTEAGRACALSPAAASYTFYRNFEERGRDFQEKVKNHGGREH